MDCIKNLSMEMDRSRQRILEILIFIDFSLVIILNAGLIKNFPVEEDRTEQIFFHQSIASFRS